MDIDKLIPKKIKDFKLFAPIRDEIGLVFGITLIPIIFTIPFILYVIWAVSITPNSNFSFLYKVIIFTPKLVFFFFLIGLLITKRVRSFFTKSNEAPFVVVSFYLINTYLMISDNYRALTPGDTATFRAGLPYLFISLVLFLIINYKTKKGLFSNRYSLLLKIPVWCIMFFYAMFFLEVWGTQLFFIFFKELG